MTYESWALRVSITLGAIVAALAAVRSTWRGIRNLARVADAFFGSPETGPGVFARQAAAEERDHDLAAKLDQVADRLEEHITWSDAQSAAWHDGLLLPRHITRSGDPVG